MDIFVNIPVESTIVVVPAVIAFIIAAVIGAVVYWRSSKNNPNAPIGLLFVVLIVAIFVFSAVSIVVGCINPSTSPEQLANKGIEGIQQNYNITLSVDQQDAIKEALMGERKIRVPSNEPSWIHDYADPQAELFPLGTMWLEQEDGSIKEVPYAFRVSPITEQMEAGEAQGMHIELYAKSADDGDWDVVSPEQVVDAIDKQTE